VGELKADAATDILGDGIAQIELLDFLGGDLAAVNGARASFATRKADFDDKDARLLGRLGRDIHHTPLRHTYFQFYIEAPEAIARQWFKHCVGCEYSFKDLPWSEFSQRYKDVPCKFYIPRHLRRQSNTNKQASAGRLKR
jgi:thymidylate synthase ThyX